MRITELSSTVELSDNCRVATVAVTGKTIQSI